MSHLGMDLSHLCGKILSHSEKRKRKTVKLTDKQKEEVNMEIYQQVQENLDDLTVFEDYWHGMTCSDGTVLDINIYDTEVYGIDAKGCTFQEGLHCVVYAVDEDNTIDYEQHCVLKSKHLDGIAPLTNAQVEVYF